QGIMMVENGTHQDALVKIVPSGANTASCVFYVAAGRQAHITFVPDGIYSILFALGRDWDPITTSFRNPRSFRRFDDVLNFESYYDAYASHHSSYELTLHTVPGGRARTSGMAEAEFDRY